MTGAMMVLTLKIISAAACYQDGSKPDQVCTAGPPTDRFAARLASLACRATKTQSAHVAQRVLRIPPVLSPAKQQPGDHATAVQELSDYQKAHKLDRMLSPVEWVSYLFSAGNLLAGACLPGALPVLVAADSTLKCMIRRHAEVFAFGDRDDLSLHRFCVYALPKKLPELSTCLLQPADLPRAVGRAVL